MKLFEHFNPFRKRSALSIAIEHLEDAQRARLEHAKSREYHQSMESMLGDRIQRLRCDIADLTNETTTQEKVDQSIAFEREAGFAMQLLANNEYLRRVLRGDIYGIRADFKQVAMNAKGSLLAAVVNVASIGVRLGLRVQRRPTRLLSIAIEHLEDAQRARLEHAKSREYHQSMESMLGDRIQRLRCDIADLTNETTTQEKAS
jgi:uncharacterized protein YbcI